jgi:hypothetical protein
MPTISKHEVIVERDMLEVIAVRLRELRSIEMRDPHRSQDKINQLSDLIDDCARLSNVPNE